MTPPPPPTLGQIGDVRVSHHATTSPDYCVAAPHAYSAATDVGAVVLAADRHFDAHPSLLRIPDLARPRGRSPQGPPLAVVVWPTIAPGIK